MKIAIIAEKPSVAREIAAIVGASHKEDGFMTGNGYMVTYAFGHLIQLAMPEDYGFSGFVKENLPIIPETFILKPRQIRDGKEYKPDAGALKQLKVIKHVFDSCDKIVVATDAGREGCLIFRYIYHHLNCKKPFDRLWISSLTDKAIKDGLQNLKQGSDYDNLYYAAKARSEADWLVGINASQALSIAAGRGVYSLGRVQTPTLAMICRRFLENKNFTPVPFWQIRVQTEKANIPFSVISREKYGSKDMANAIFQKLQGNSLQVQNVEKKEVNQESPLLYDLTALQKEANQKYGFSADKTLSIAQKLYEAKLITYPRTGSCYISADVFDEIPELINSLKTHPRFGGYAAKMDTQILNIRCVDDKKVTDHHALLITGNMPKDLSGEEQTIYEMVAGRMLEAFSKKCVKDATTIVCICADTLFEAKGAVIKQAGWRAVFNEKEETDEDGALPEVTQGETLPILKSELLEKQTKPKPLHTEASLLSEMETAGKTVENGAERAAMKESGIGTPATRAAIIETLFSRNYIVREKKSLVPTEKGLTVYETVKDKRIADVALTGSWENTLAQIERGEMQPETFQKTIEIYTRQITMELLDTKITVSDENACVCPKCKTANIRFYPKVAKCSDPNCGLVVFRTISEKELTDKQILELLTKGKTAVINGFKSKAGKIFPAALKFDDEYKVTFDFSDKKKKFGKK
ncbi:DNA topoisomerase [Bacteroidia bacterium]|nr:DNA topoisomerase [Bacteroidia bacterium]GHT28138.1 DNA topoisomerase [Bacteroidia bacterium]GHU83174.1 DNA topoisomerase [Bacteroidia bacterium]